MDKKLIEKEKLCAEEFRSFVSNSGVFVNIDFNLFICPLYSDLTHVEKISHKNKELRDEAP